MPSNVEPSEAIGRHASCTCKKDGACAGRLLKRTSCICWIVWVVGCRLVFRPRASTGPRGLLGCERQVACGSLAVDGFPWIQIWIHGLCPFHSTVQRLFLFVYLSFENCVLALLHSRSDNRDFVSTCLPSTRHGNTLYTHASMSFPAFQYSITHILIVGNLSGHTTSISIKLTTRV